MEGEARMSKKRIFGTKEWASHNVNFCIGCRHDCRYCVSGDTLILMANGTQRKIETLLPGSKIIGVEKTETGWYFCPSTVLNIWNVKKHSFGLSTEISKTNCSANHQWLTERGWKETAVHRSYGWKGNLSKNRIRCIGGKAVETPEDSLDYKKGYFYGAAKGDGTHGKYVYYCNGKRSIIILFRQANKDAEILGFVKQCLKDVFGISTFHGVFNNSGMELERTNKKHDHHLIAFFLNRFNPCTFNKAHHERSVERARGFLAGIFDAEGSSGKKLNIIRIHNTDEKLLKQIETAMDILGFKHTRDKQKNKNCQAVRILGGRDELIRFFSYVHPRISRKFSLAGAKVSNSTSVVSIGRISRKEKLLWDMQTSSENFIANGCVAHNCYAKHNAVNRFKTVLPGNWATEIIDSEAVARSYPTYNGTVMLPTTHDITPGNLDAGMIVIEKLLLSRNKLLIVTKPHYQCVAKICDEFKSYIDQIVFRFTICAFNDKILKYWEPGAPCFGERLSALKYAFDSGYQTSISMEPCLDWPNVVSNFGFLSQYVNHSIWIGTLNFIDERVKVVTEEDRKMVDQMKSWMINETFQIVYNELKDHPLIKWKESMKKALGLKEAEEIGQDI